MSFDRLQLIQTLEPAPAPAACAGAEVGVGSAPEGETGGSRSYGE